MQQAARRVAARTVVAAVATAAIVFLVGLVLGDSATYALKISLFVGLFVGGGLGFLISWRLEH